MRRERQLAVVEWRVRGRGCHDEAWVRHGGGLLLLVMFMLAGCARPIAPPTARNPGQLEAWAMDCLKAAIRYPHNPAVRVEAIEALQDLSEPSAAPWIRLALLDEHPAVRFAACLAVGERRDAGAELAVANCLDDPDPSVRVGALFAWHRLGHTERSGELAGYLLNHSDVTVRRNAALVLGILGESGAIKVLARAMKDPDRGVRHHALEAMARLGNREARQELTFMTNTGIGSEEVFAINALAGTRDPTYADTFRYKLVNAQHLETRLAAGRGLGLLRSDEGYDVAMAALRSPRPIAGDVGDPPAGQVLRIQQLAAGSLGAIGRTAALGPLEQVLAGSPDPRVQVSAARAILGILEGQKNGGLPVSAVGAATGGS